VNRITLVAVSVSLTVAIIVIGVSIYLGNTPSPSTKPIINFKVNSFNLTGYYNPVGVVWIDMFNLTYANNGPKDVENITIIFRTNSTYEMNRIIDVFYSKSLENYTGEFLMGEPYLLGDIKANETKDFIGGIWNYLGDSSKIHGFALTATLKSNDIFLDQATIMIPPLV
jgi:hypothetical protein